MGGVHQLSKGLTQAAVASIPCQPDLRQLRFEVQHTRISNPALAAELEDFTHDCYALALYQWKQRDRRGQATDPAVLLAGDYHTLQSLPPERRFCGTKCVTMVGRRPGRVDIPAAKSGGQWRKRD
ncbi:TraG-like protein [Photorhabdus khanii NC19]|uniref:TraG-like protein n=1 Tax=Photorhabdus khanii NC19 TaxID=1004151 RepID=W3VA84_9GAMM|nr:TraG-like protein [Photorhabdus khanii NC19]